MPDIAMCTDKECHFHNHCLRFKSKPSAQQSYFKESPRINDVCEFFWEIVKQRREK
jgi:hypothetical protein